MKRYVDKISRASNATNNSKSKSPKLKNDKEKKSSYFCDTVKERTPLNPINLNRSTINQERDKSGNKAPKSERKKKKKKKMSKDRIHSPQGSKKHTKNPKWNTNMLKGEKSYTSVLNQKNKTKVFNKPKNIADYNNLRLLRRKGVGNQNQKEKKSSFNEQKNGSFSPLNNRHAPKYSISKKPNEEEPSKTQEHKFDNYYKLSLKSRNVTNKLKESDFLFNTGKQLEIIKNSMKKGAETYEDIRIYADLAQEFEFDIIEEIFSDLDAKKLCSRILKFERWAIILVFYFEIVKNKNAKLKNLLKGMIETVWNNQCFMVNWMRILVEKHKLDWDLSEMFENFIPDISTDSDSLIVKMVNSCQLITGYLIKV